MRRWSIHLTPLLCGLAGVSRGGSLLIFLLAMGIWVRSYFAMEYVYRISADTAQPAEKGAKETVVLWVVSYRDILVLGRDRIPQRNETGTVMWHHDSEASRRFFDAPPLATDQMNLKFAGFRLRRSPLGTVASSWLITVPLWLFLFFAIPPLLWLRRWRRAQGRGFEVEVQARDPGRSEGANLTCDL